MSDYKVTDTELTSIADAIRAKTGKSAQMEFPTEFVSEIGSIFGSGNVIESDQVPLVGDMNNGDVVIFYSREGASNIKPAVATPVAGIAGQNSNDAINALNYDDDHTNTGIYTWTTGDRNYTDIWVGGDYGEPVVLNSFAVAPRTWNDKRQIYTAIMEGSNDLNTWVKICESYAKGNDIPDTGWYCTNGDNTTPYRYYRLRTELDSNVTINGSITFTIAGLGFFYGQSGFKTYIKAYYKIGGVLYEI